MARNNVPNLPLSSRRAEQSSPHDSRSESESEYDPSPRPLSSSFQTSEASSISSGLPSSRSLTTGTSESSDNEDRPKPPPGPYCERPAFPLEDRWNDKLEDAHEVIYDWAARRGIQKAQIAKLITYADEQIKTAAFMQREYVHTNMGLLVNDGEKVYGSLPDEVKQAVYTIFPERSTWGTFFMCTFIPLCCCCCCGVAGFIFLLFYFYLLGYSECGAETVLDGGKLFSIEGCVEAVLQSFPSPPPPPGVIG